jgi:hypothetical protein
MRDFFESFKTLKFIHRTSLQRRLIEVPRAEPYFDIPLQPKNERSFVIPRTKSSTHKKLLNELKEDIEGKAKFIIVCHSTRH